ncbi:hypothetical protein NHX12_005231 [Muraenolepis orangiensis]|uniref:Uncharacterized protein n=1 Tax=Muraenolepis orangiensis TaxID=630683 RepID=A0A9Q0DSS7_9TELE|nr:hypothetical protein NHX12_005231 [Muraenolepis orangiensis]
MEEAGPEPQAHGDDNAAAVQSQVALYLSEPAISMSAQPLAYWRANQALSCPHQSCKGISVGTLHKRGE